jgi:hypothetical protein
MDEAHGSGGGGMSGDGEMPGGSGTNNDPGTSGGGGGGGGEGEGKPELSSTFAFVLSYICHGDLERFTTLKENPISFLIIFFSFLISLN